MLKYIHTHIIFIIFILFVIWQEIIILILANNTFNITFISYTLVFIIIFLKFNLYSNLSHNNLFISLAFIHALRLIYEFNFKGIDIIGLLRVDRLVSFQEKLLGVYEVYYSVERANLVGAIILGERSGISSLTVMLRDAGVGHLLALSGMHVGYAALLVYLLFKYLPINTYLKLTIEISILLGYILLAGASPSLMRAGFMWVVARILIVNNIKISIMNLLGVAGILILLIEPGMLYQAGFQISFLVVISIYFFINRFKKLPSPVAVSLAATIGSFPWLSWISLGFNLNGLISNLIMIPFFIPIYILNLMILVFHWAFPDIGLFLSKISDFLISIFINTGSYLAGLPFNYKLNLIGRLHHYQGYFFMPLPLIVLYITIFAVFNNSSRPNWLKSRSLLTLTWKAVVLISIINFIVLYL
ncbi:ComEC/Rec2 family competence protein [Halanaerobiaceae bacterium Z-7014]|uniref:ComEC/Rec2 family competence protein n=1 Tax=Halonatronomonas betaini TaxID=2778430 RepID=A0A931F9J6_9FIRM|nr:ComEC/Rec2 family competence protein [Halonatronomonas betaini]MBF8436002.1 ComEC/Rec2 family competence protein [Halonatronomonas betaini]